MNKKQRELIDIFVYAAAKATKVHTDWIRTEKSRNGELARARSIVVHLIKTDKRTNKLTLSEIGKLIASKDHSTVIHANTRVEQALTPNKNGNYIYNPKLRNAFLRAKALVSELTEIKIPKFEEGNLFERRVNIMMAKKEIDSKLESINQEIKQYYENYGVDND